MKAIIAIRITDTVIVPAFFIINSISISFPTRLIYALISAADLRPCAGRRSKYKIIPNTAKAAMDPITLPAPEKSMPS